MHFVSLNLVHSSFKITFTWQAVFQVPHSAFLLSSNLAPSSLEVLLFTGLACFWSGPSGAFGCSQAGFVGNSTTNSRQSTSPGGVSTIHRLGAICRHYSSTRCHLFPPFIDLVPFLATIHRLYSRCHFFGRLSHSGSSLSYL